MEEIGRMGIRELRLDIGNRVDAAFYRDEPTIITKNRNGEPRAVIISYRQFEDLVAPTLTDTTRTPRSTTEES